MRKIIWGLVTVAMVFLYACSSEIRDTALLIPKDGEEITITAYSESPAQTKTGIVDNGSGGKSVVWKSGNSISLFFNQGSNGGNKFTTTTNGPIAEFTGTISAVSGDLSGVGGSAYFWGLYPYNADASCDGSSITATLPASQLAYEGDVADDLLVTVGRSENLSIYFKNTCAIVGFTLSQNNITKVTFSGNNDEYVAGEFKVSFDINNNLDITPTSNAVKSIEITPGESSTFDVGKTYYFAILPQRFLTGYTLTFTRSDESSSTYERTSSFNFAISTFYTMTNKDSYPKAIDMGLSVKWASFNLGATYPEDFGDCYAWGETETKENYSNETYKWYDDGDWEWLTKYNNDYSYGFVDNKTVLEAEDDAAHVKLGGTWRMPTFDNWAELLSNCTWTMKTLNGVKGMLVTSNKNGASIFLPFSPCWIGNKPIYYSYEGYYWSSTLGDEEPYNAFGILVTSESTDIYDGSDLWNYSRECGFSIRPVSD